jgi:hypothetical protein
VLTATETKDTIPDGRRERLVEALLASPLALELNRSMNEGPAAVRAKAATALVEATRRHDIRMARLTSRAKDLVEKRDVAKRAFETADAAARDAADQVALEQMNGVTACRELQAISTASAAWLESQGLADVAAFEKKYGR